MPTLKLQLHELLRQREDREERRTRLTEVAEATGVSVNVLTPMINNQVDRVSLQVLAKLCDYLHCTPTEMLRYEADPIHAEVVDGREIVDKWHQEYGADEHPRH